MKIIFLRLAIVALGTIFYVERGVSAVTFPLPEWNALEDFYESLNGLYWVWKNDTESNGRIWNFTKPLTNSSNPCSERWQGIDCTVAASTYRVSSLALDGYNLTGSIPDSISTLSSLSLLSLSVNHIIGSLPSGLYELSSLETLILSVNNISGSLGDDINLLERLHILDLSYNNLSNILPEGLWNLLQLQILDLSFNQFRDVIPNQIGFLAKLQLLDLSFNNFFGWLPVDLSLLTELEVLSLAHNADIRGTIPSDFGNLTQLEILNLSGNGINGSLPNKLSKLVNLEVLIFSDNKYLTGTVPTEFEDLKKLKTLILGQTSLSGFIFETIVKLTALEVLILVANPFSGEIPDDIFRLKNLTLIDLESIPINGSLPTELAELSNLELIILQDLSLVGEIPYEYSRLTKLKEFIIDGLFFLTGSLPPEFSQLKTLEVLQIHNCSMFSSIPPDYGNLRNLRVLDLSIDLYGTLPRELSQLTSLNVLELRDSGLTVQTEYSSGALSGSIPPEYGNLTSLTLFSISYASINCSLPAELSLLKNLDTLIISGTSLRGTIPAGLGELKGLKVLDLSYNDLSGTIPYQLSSLTELVNLYLSYNQKLSGSIPSELFDNCANLIYLYISFTNVSGTLPSVYTNLVNLFHLDLQSNRLTGTVPSSLLKLPALNELYLNNNSFSGSLIAPDFDEIDAPLPLAIVEMSNNDIAGSIPCELFTDKWSSVIAFFAYNNRLTGSLPDSIRNLTNLIYLQLQNNSMSGSLPEGLAQLKNIAYLRLFNNSFDGIIPPAMFSNYDIMVDFELQNNYFSGTINPLFANFTLLQTLSLSNNSFSGPIPSEIVRLPYLTELFLRSNQLTGNISSLFHNIVQSRLFSIDLSYNQLSGTIPPELFEIATLQSLSLVSNCFSGSIPTSVCTSETLVSLALDGLSGSPSCRSQLFTTSFRDMIDSVGMFYTDAYALQNPITGGVPPCLFQMPKLQTLHLSGNGLAGSLSIDTDEGGEVLPITTSIVDLSLSNNLLSGTIPVSILQHTWKKLDLSFNRFTGVLSDNITVSYVQDDDYDYLFYNSTLVDLSVSLQVNRLSGSIPPRMKELSSVNILVGNIFYCDLQKKQLPPNDPDSSIYQCGSSSVDIAVYVWLGFAVFVTVSIALLLLFLRRNTLNEEDSPPLRYIHDIVGSFRRWIKPIGNIRAGDINYVHIAALETTLSDIRRYSLFFSAFVLLILMPTYTAFTLLGYNSYYYEYGWTVSIAYINGGSPAVVLALLLITMLFIATGLCEFLSWTSESCLKTSSPKNATGWLTLARLQRYVLYSLLFLANLIVNVTVNAVYVYIFTQYNQTVVTISQLTIAGVKMVWNSLCNIYLIRLLQFYENRRSDLPAVEKTEEACADTIDGINPMIELPDRNTNDTRLSKSESRSVSSATPNKDDRSMNLSIGRTDTVTSSSHLDSAVSYSIHRDDKVQSENMGDSSKLSSHWDNTDIIFLSFVTVFNYIIFPCLVVAVIDKNCYYDLFFTPDSVESSYEYSECNRLEPEPLSGDILYSCVYGVQTQYVSYVPPFQYSYQCSSSFVLAYSAIYVYMFTFIGFLLPVGYVVLKYLHDHFGPSKSFLYAQTLGRVTPNILRSINSITYSRRIFCKDRFVTSVVSDVAILFTFGVAYPPLAAIIGVAIFNRTYTYQILIGRYLSMTETDPSHILHVDLLNKQCIGLSYCVWHSLRILTPFVCCFYALFLFDIIGGAEGQTTGFTFFVVVIVVPLTLVFALRLFPYDFTSKYLSNLSDIPDEKLTDSRQSPSVTEADDQPLSLDISNRRKESIEGTISTQRSSVSLEV